SLARPTLWPIPTQWVSDLAGLEAAWRAISTFLRSELVGTPLRSFLCNCAGRGQRGCCLQHKVRPKPTFAGLRRDQIHEARRPISSIPIGRLDSPHHGRLVKKAAHELFALQGPSAGPLHTAYIRLDTPMPSSGETS